MLRVAGGEGVPKVGFPVRPKICVLSFRLDHGDLLVMDESKCVHRTVSGLQGPRVYFAFRWTTQHIASCPLPGVMCCALPSCVQGLAELGSGNRGNKLGNLGLMVFLLPIGVCFRWEDARVERWRKCCHSGSPLNTLGGVFPDGAFLEKHKKNHCKTFTLFVHGLWGSRRTVFLGEGGGRGRGLVIWRHPGPIPGNGVSGRPSVEFVNVGGWLSNGDMALDSCAQFQAVAGHGLFPAKARSIGLQLRKALVVMLGLV